VFHEVYCRHSLGRMLCARKREKKATIKRGRRLEERKE
jgi:hypothetical protein